MRPFFTIALTLSMFLSSCEKEDYSEFPLSAIIDTTIFATDTLTISFGYFGDEEGVSVISSPEHAASFQILNKQWEERILQYIPRDGFLGIDSARLVTMRGSDGAGPSTETDTLLIVIKVVQNDFHRQLTGKWHWFRSCGGFTGGCWYPGDYECIEFRNDMKYLEYRNDSLIKELQYMLMDSFMNEQILLYEIGFDNGYDTYCYFAGDTLNVQGGDFWAEYERIEYTPERCRRQDETMNACIADL